MAWSSRSSFRSEVLVLLAMLVVYASAIVWESWHTGITVDEPSHLLSAYLYWDQQDVLEPHDMPPLLKIAGGALPHAFYDLPVPTDNPQVMNTGHEWQISQAMMDRFVRGDIQKVFFWGRLGMLVFPLATTVLLWWWARQLFTPLIGLVLAALFMLEPTVLGHAALLKNDLAATFGYLLFWYTAWRFWREPSALRLLLFAAALLVATLAKLSMMVLVAVWPVVVAARLLTMKKRDWRMWAAVPASLLVLYVGTLAAYQFDARVLTPMETNAAFDKGWLPQQARTVVEVAQYVPVPVKLWRGAMALARSNSNSGIYILGQVYRAGHPLYFLVAFALKVPVPLQLLFLAGVVYAALSSRLMLVVPLLLYFGLASLSNLQLGLRLVLPCFPFVFLAMGAAMEAMLQKKAGRTLLALACGWAALTTAVSYPGTLSYLNPVPGEPYEWISDSNIDWGQDLPALREAFDKLNLRQMNLFYFGSDNPYRFFAPAQLTRIPPPWTEQFAGGVDEYTPKPGVYAISASLLTGQLFMPKYENYFKRFRVKKPIARIARSIYIFQMD